AHTFDKRLPEINPGRVECHPLRLVYRYRPREPEWHLADTSSLFIAVTKLPRIRQHADGAAVKKFNPRILGSRLEVHDNSETAVGVAFLRRVLNRHDQCAFLKTQYRRSEYRALQ